MAQFSSVAMIMGLPPQQQQGRSTTQFFPIGKIGSSNFFLVIPEKEQQKRPQFSSIAMIMSLPPPQHEATFSNWKDRQQKKFLFYVFASISGGIFNKQKSSRKNALLHSGLAKWCGVDEIANRLTKKKV